MANVQEHAAREFPPSNATDMHTMQTMVTGAAAAAADLWAGFSADNKPHGKVLVHFEALTQSAYIRIGATSTTATTSSNGTLIATGAQGHHTFFLDPEKHIYVDAIAPGGAAVLKWWVCSKIAERNYI